MHWPKKGQPPKKGNFRGSMSWDPVSGTPSKINQSLLSNRFFWHLVDIALQSVAGKPPPLSTENAIDLQDEVLYGGFLNTVKEKPQIPHIDEKHDALRRYKKKLPGVFSFAPFSIDLPVTDDGMRLCLYGSHPQGYGRNGIELAIQEGTLFETPVMVEIHHGEAILFR